MKYAIAQTSGKQFLVKPGQWYDIDFINKVSIKKIYPDKVQIKIKEHKIIGIIINNKKKYPLYYFNLNMRSD